MAPIALVLRHENNGIVTLTLNQPELRNPISDLDVIDSRAPRFNQTVIGAVSVEPWLSDARDKGMRTMAPANGIASVFVASAWVGSQAWAEAHPGVVAPFVSAIYTAGHWGNTK